MKLLPFIGLSSLVNLFSISNVFAQVEMVSATPPLAVYAGKYVYDEVDGTCFLNHPQVRAAIEAAVPTGDVRDILYTEVRSSHRS